MSTAPTAFEGIVASGRAEASGFTTAPWARDGFRRLVGIDPFPGTLNLRVETSAARAAWAALRARPGIRMVPPDPAWCDARLYPVLVAGRVAGAIVLPEVSGYPEDQVEIVAALRLRDALGLGDGDSVEVRVTGEGVR